jgi:hypothetical protein
VSTATKRAVERAYRLPHTPGAWEIDHLISLQLGGSNDPANLSPERYRMALGAYAKDSVENWTHRKVCSGEVALADAQRAIATDWTRLYRFMHAELDPPEPPPAADAAKARRARRHGSRHIR